MTRFDAPEPYLIAFVADFPEIDEIQGGEAVRPFELFRWAGEAGIEGSIWCINPTRPRHRDIGSVSVRTIRLPGNGPLRRLLLGRAIRRTLREEAARAHGANRRPVLYQRVPGGVVLKWGVLPVRAEPAWKQFRLARKLGVATWASIQDISPDQERSIVRRKRLRKVAGARVLLAGELNAGAQRRALSSADLVTVVSEGMRELVESRYPATGKVRILWAGVHGPTFESMRVDSCADQRGALRVGYLGAALDADISMLVSAIAALPAGARVELVIAGARAGGAWQEEAMRNGVKVRFLGDARYADFALVTSEVDAWVVPHGREAYFDLAWPLKLPMYMASGLPVVVTTSKEVERHALRDLLFVVEPTPDGIAAGLQAILDDPTAAGERALEARETVLRDYTWAVQLQRCLAVAVSSATTASEHRAGSLRRP